MSVIAIIPAAGLSRRMGSPKLTLPLNGKPLIRHVVESLFDGGADRVLCVVRPTVHPYDSAPERDARAAGAEICVCDPPPPDMRASVEHGVSVLEGQATPPRGILLCPGDSPGISADLVRRVLNAFDDDQETIVLPRSGDKRGHPVAIPWDLALSIRELPSGTGVNALHGLHPDRRRFLPVDDDPDLFADLDTPQDYRAWQERLERRRDQA